ncbi:hypothetical protein VDGD_21753 [Verticillium dahliae]|nr:hypothetical protein VDGD_21753 [Verticillium dahliae]
MTWPEARRGLMVTLPLPSWYMRNMFELDMRVPVPRPIQAYESGAEIWK